MDDETTKPLLHLGDFLPYRLSVLSNTISSTIAADYEREFGLNVWQWRVMAVLGERPGLTARDVTVRTAMDKVAVSRAVSGLEGKGLLSRETHPGDGRAAHLHLTAEGLDIYRKIVPAALAHEERLLAGLTSDERRWLEHLLPRLAAAAAPGSALW